MKAMRIALVASVLVGGSGCGLLLDLDPPDRDGGARDAAAPADGGSRRDGGQADAGIDGGIDGGSRMDASANDAGPDGGRDDAGEPPRADAGPDAGRSCRPDIVEFPMGGPLENGTLCDEIVVCPSDDGVEEVRGTAPSLSCDTPGASVLCGELAPCSVSPEASVLDAALIAEICALTQLASPPRIVCRVFL